MQVFLVFSLFYNTIKKNKLCKKIKGNSEAHGIQTYIKFIFKQYSDNSVKEQIYFGSNKYLHCQRSVKTDKAKASLLALKQKHILL